LRENFFRGVVPFSPLGKGAENHTGNIWLSGLNVGDSTFDPSIAMATYDAGAKLDWDVHPGGQVLLITEGRGSEKDYDSVK